MPESEKVERFTPKIQPMFTSNGKDRYYFDMKNNREHYELLTSDVTPEQFAVYEDREKLRVDALHHSRQMMQELIARRNEEERKREEEKIAQMKKKIDVDSLGQYQSSAFAHQKENVFDDDDEMILMEILMDESARMVSKDASKQHMSKQKNNKAMLCPQKVLRMDEFARDIVNGIIWDGVKQKKVNPQAIFKMGF